MTRIAPASPSRCVNSVEPTTSVNKIARNGRHQRLTRDRTIKMAEERLDSRPINLDHLGATIPCASRCTASTTSADGPSTKRNPTAVMIEPVRDVIDAVLACTSISRAWAYAISKGVTLSSTSWRSIYNGILYLSDGSPSRTAPSDHGEAQPIPQPPCTTSCPTSRAPPRLRRPRRTRPIRRP